MIGTLSYDTSVASADRMDGLSALAAATRTSCEAFTAVVFQSFSAVIDPRHGGEYVSFCLRY